MSGTIFSTKNEKYISLFSLKSQFRLASKFLYQRLPIGRRQLGHLKRIFSCGVSGASTACKTDAEVLASEAFGARRALQIATKSDSKSSLADVQKNALVLASKAFGETARCFFYFFQKSVRISIFGTARLVLCLPRFYNILKTGVVFELCWLLFHRICMFVGFSDFTLIFNTA